MAANNPSVPISAASSEDMVREYKIPQVIAASAVGTVIEWYDFYIFGSLATTIAPLFYPPGNDALALIAYLSTFAVGFVVRPFGALFFGRIGDIIGRKYAFLVTLLIMGGATALIGFLPTYATIGIAAPIILLTIRILQGLALGGEYGGAVIYVAEHVPDEKRGFYTSFIQITATFGLFVSLAVILLVQNMMSKEAFAAWGWRLPFIFSIFLVLISLYIRLRMKESPIYQQIKSAGMTSAKPLVESFTRWENLRRVLISLFGATAGQGVIWYTGQFFALYYLQAILKVDNTSANYIVAVALLLGVPFFIFFGWLSDHVGRKKIIMLGCLLAALSYFPIYRAMHDVAGSNVATVRSQKNPVTGAQTLTPLARTESGELQPIKTVLPYNGLSNLLQNPTAWKLDLSRLATGDLGDHGLWTDRGLLGRGFSGQDPLLIALAAVPHRQRRARRVDPISGSVGHRLDGQHLRRPLLSDHRRRDHADRRHDLHARDATRQDMGRGARHQPVMRLFKRLSGALRCGGALHEAFGENFAREASPILSLDAPSQARYDSCRVRLDRTLLLLAGGRL